jgi:hypothetical protein
MGSDSAELLLYGGFGDGTERDEIYLLDTSYTPLSLNNNLSSSCYIDIVYCSDSGEITSVTPVDSYTQATGRAGHAAYVHFES